MTKSAIRPSSLNQYYWSCDAAIHPNGQKLAYVLKNINSEQDYYITHIRTVDIDGSQDDRLTTGINDSHPLWSPNGEKLAFLRLTEGVNQIWLIDEEKKVEQQMTFTKRSISEFQWLSDGTGFVYITKTHLDEMIASKSIDNLNRHPERRGKTYTVPMPKAEGSGWWDGLYSHLFYFNIAENKIKQLTNGAFQVSQIQVMDNKIACLAKKNNGDHFVSEKTPHGLIVLNQDGQLKQVVSQSFEILNFNWMNEGREILFIAHNRQFGSATHNRLYKVNLERNIIEQMSDDDVQLGVYMLNDMLVGKSVPGPYCTLYDNKEGKTEKSFYALVSHDGETQIWEWKNNRNGRPITKEAWVINQFYRSNCGTSFIVNASYSDRPAELYSIEQNSGHVRQLTAWNSAFCEQYEISIPQQFSYTNHENEEIQCWILLPKKSNDNESIPLVLSIHGGPHAMYTPAYSHEFQSIVAQGYALLFCNPRGSFGYGQAFATGCLKRFGYEDYNDVMDAVDVALDKYPQLDAKRLGVMGGSYGGLMTNWIVGQTNRFSVAISQRSISNWLSFYSTSDIGARYTEAMVGSHPWKDPLLLWNRSPIAYANQVNTPILIMHGEQDMRCPIEQSDEWYASLRHLGKTAKLVRYAASNHAFQKAGKPSLRIDLNTQVNEWLHQHLNKPVVLGIPFAMLLENCRTSGATDEEIAYCIEKKDFSSIERRVKEKEMPFIERVELAEQLEINWNAVFKYGYQFSFVHTNAIKRLLNFRYDLVEGQHYTEQNYEIHAIKMSEIDMIELKKLIEVQWEIRLEHDGYVIARKSDELT